MSGSRLHRPLSMVAAIGVLAVSSALAQAPATSSTPPPATAATQPGDERTQLRLARMAELAPLPVVRVEHAAQVVVLDIDDAGHLRLRTTVPPTSGRVRVEIGDLPGLATLAISGPRAADPAPAAEAGADGEPYEPRVFQLIHEDYDEPKAILDQTTVMLGPGNIQIARDRDEGQGLLRVELIQSGVYLEQGKDERVRLYVTRTSDGESDRALRVSATSFEQLRRRHAGPVVRYLHPVLRDLGQSSEMVSVDQQAAWHVLAGRYGTDEQTKRNVAELVAQLDVDDAAVRDQAAQRLREMGQPAAVVLLGLDRGPLSPEQRNQVDNLLVQLAPLPTDDVAAVRNDPLFMVEVLDGDDPALRAAALVELERLLGRPVGIDPNAPAEQRRPALARLRDELLASATMPATVPNAPSQR